MVTHRFSWGTLERSVTLIAECVTFCLAIDRRLSHHLKALYL